MYISDFPQAHTLNDQSDHSTRTELISLTETLKKRILDASEKGLREVFLHPWDLEIILPPDRTIIPQLHIFAPDSISAALSKLGEYHFQTMEILIKLQHPDILFELSSFLDNHGYRFTDNWAIDKDGLLRINAMSGSSACIISW